MYFIHFLTICSTWLHLLYLMFKHPYLNSNKSYHIFRHVLVNSFKFGVIYQSVGQMDEEAMFGNRTHSPAMDNFLDMIGHRVTLFSHSGYRGGLDTKYGQTGQYSVYTEHMGKEVMFHVATLLPFSETDTQQLQRKRHIGNDIVSLVFQEGSTPFSPDMVTSHFLHAYILVQPEPGSADKYRVSVTARADVPYFGPSLPSPPVFRRGPQFREWILNKLISAETACYKAERFSKLKQRTQATLLNNLVEDLTSKTEEFINCSEGDNVAKMTRVESSFFKSMKKVMSSKPKSQAASDYSPPRLIPITRTISGNSNYESFLTSSNGYGSVSLMSTGQSSNSSFFSREASPLSNTSSPEQNSLDSSDCVEAASIVTVEAAALNSQVSKLQQEVARLKVDKLELLRQNVAAQRELKR